MFSFGKNKKENQEREEERNRKVAESQTALLSAAIATADMAQEVTVGLKKRLDDIVKQFENTARILRDGLVICNEAGIVTTFNPAAERIFGIKAGVALRKPVLNLFEGAHGEIADLPTLWNLLQNEDQEDVLGVKNGVTFPIRVTVSVLDRHDGTRNTLLLVHDVRDLAPVNRDRRYQTIFESAFDGIVVVLDTDGSFVAANPAVARMFGYSTEELMGRTIFDLVVERDRAVVAACCPQEVAKIVPQHFSVEGRHSSGRHVNLIFTLTDIQWDGKAATLATIKDVTEMRRVESVVTLKRDNGIDRVVCFDPTFRITFANETFASAVGTKRSDLVGMDVRTLMTDIDAATFMAGIAKLTPENPAARSICRDDVCVVDWVDHAHFDDEGRPIEYHRVGRDIAESIKAPWN